MFAANNGRKIVPRTATPAFAAGDEPRPVDRAAAELD
jgi:hypothetical protein